MSVAENVAFGLEMKKVPKDEIGKRVAEALDMVRLSSYGERKPRQMSGGQQQRVALARALVNRPDVLLLDEPLGALDLKLRQAMQIELKEIQQEVRLTFVYVTHDQEEALELSEHVVLLQDGKVVQAGSPHDVYDRPSTPFVASFLGGANVLRGQMKDGRVDIGTQAVDGPRGAENGVKVQAFVRPHDIRIEKATAEPEHDVQLAKIVRMTRIGGQVKLTVELGTGDSITVQMAKAEVDQLGVEQGDRVMVDLKEAKVFVEDYTI